MPILDAVDAPFDGLVGADVQHGQGQGFAVRVPGGFHQFVFALQVAHGCYDYEQAENREGRKESRERWFKMYALYRLLCRLVIFTYI